MKILYRVYSGDVNSRTALTFKYNFSNTNEKREFIKSNAVAIMMPYIRSELTLLTSQPGVDPIVLPPFNVQAMLNNQK